jgi:hypothetical protein
VCRALDGQAYGQACGIARALELIGNRWTLLIIRELLSRGACRYLTCATDCADLVLRGPGRTITHLMFGAITVAQARKRGLSIEGDIRLLDRPEPGDPRRVAAAYQGTVASLDQRSGHMSVLMTFRTKGDPALLEKRAGDNPDGLRAIVEEAKTAGLIAHRFYGTDDGQIMVLDEWPDAESFQRFFAANRTTIEPLMTEVGATGEPEVTFWRELDTHDQVGWQA